MTNRNNLDLSTATLDDLLSGLTDSPGHAPCGVLKWAQLVGVYPGTTRVGCTDLYAEYIHYCNHHADFVAEHGPPKAIRIWGKVMTQHYKSGRGNKGNFYYISRETVVVVPLSLQAGGGGTLGG